MHERLVVTVTMTDSESESESGWTPKATTIRLLSQNIHLVLFLVLNVEATTVF